MLRWAPTATAKVHRLRAGGKGDRGDGTARASTAGSWDRAATTAWWGDGETYVGDTGDGRYGPRRRTTRHPGGE